MTCSNTEEYRNMIRSFIDKYGQYRRSEPGPVPIAVALLRLRLVVEEFGEFEEALTRHCAVDSPPETVVDVADALADLYYVTSGAALTYGLEVIVGGAVYVPNLAAGERHLAAAVGRFACHIHEAVMITDDLLPKLTEVAEDLGHILVGILGMANFWSIPFDAVFREVHASNMSKAVPELTETGGKYGAKLGGGGKGPHYRPPNLRPILGLQ